MNTSNDIQKMLANTWRKWPAVSVAIAAVAVILALTLGWYWILVGAAAYVVFAYVSNSNPQALRQLSSAMPQANAAPRLDLNKLQGKYRDEMQKALDKRRSIETAVAGTTDPGTRRALQDSTRDLEELTDTVYELALKAQGVESGMESSSTLSALSDDISRLDNAIKTTNDEFQKSQYYATMDGKLQQMQNFTDIKVALERWDAQLDNALSTMDTILSQVLRIRSSEMLSYSDATDQVSKSLREEVDNLKATSDAMDSVYRT
ncbi:MAG: hypothetical protein ACJ78Q_15865 [Chloroflexia bacterium]